MYLTNEASYSPDFFHWYKTYLMLETEKYIYLENTHRNPLSDDELSRRLQHYFENKEINNGLIVSKLNFYFWI